MGTPHSILRLVGHTPLVEVVRLNPNRRVKVLAKLESFNPGGSIKDRPALYMIERAEARGELTRGKVILEATSGNTGIGLALVAAVKGYRLLLAMSESVSEERRQILEALGAECLLTPARLGTDGAIEKVYELLREEPGRYFMADQFNNDDNWRAHYELTAPEIWEQTEGRLDAVVATMGTTGTVMGLARRFKEIDPRVLIIGVEPYPGHKIQGLKNMKESYKPGIFDKSILGAKVHVHDEDAFETARALAHEGIFVGMSSGAAVYVALQKAREMEEGVIVAICPDGGERYLSTPLFRARPTPALRLYNTLTRRKEGFRPIVEGQVGIYSCGPTVHELPHLGNCRRFVMADLIKRYLEYKGFEVRHVMNITDIDDKTILGAEQAGLPLAEFTRRFTDEFLADVDTLGVKRATVYPRASEHVEDMVSATRELVARGYAYENSSSVYFNISKFRSYGKLSRVDLGKIKVGSTCDLDDYEKENPTDFTLLKRSTLAELKRGIFFKTEWGNVRPGWHIECACMARKHLGETFDIHTSGRDLIFPHHENEIAIAEALSGKRFANYWLHSELVYVEGKKKMSRSAGSYVTLRDLLERGWTGREARYFLMATHYRKPLNFSEKGLYEARKSLRRLDEFTTRLLSLTPAPDEEAGLEAVAAMCTQAEERFRAAMDDDFNISVALSALFGLVRELNPLLVGEEQVGARAVGLVQELLARLNSVVGVIELCHESLAESVCALIAERERARRERDWESADRIRGQLLEQGIELIDTNRGTIWRRK